MASSNPSNQGKQGSQPASPQDSKTEAGAASRGFAAMEADKQREIASKGGKAAHESGHAHEFTPEEAREAGRKGGLASQAGGKKGGSPTGQG